MTRRLIGIIVLALALTVGAVSLTPVAQAAPGSGDPFYGYGGVLANKKPGDILKSRQVSFVAEGIGMPVATSQLLYRSVGEQGQPISGVTTVLRPPVTGPTRIISFHMAYDGLGPACDPSSTLQGRSPSVAGRVEQAVMATYLARGYTIVVPDYEGQQSEWTIGRQSAQLALDSVRAAERFLGIPASTPVGMVGYSGGSVPTEFGAELAPSYAPELDIVGAAAGGLPVDLAHNLGYVSGTKDWAGVIPALVEVYRRTYDLPVQDFLSPRGLDLIKQVRGGCIASFAADYPGLTDRDMVRAPYTGLLQLQSVRTAIADNVMGTLGRPRVPILLGVGQSDATGDGVMITADVAGLAANYCRAGVHAQFARYNGDDHGKAFFPFQVDANKFLSAAFDGRAVPAC